MKVIIPEEIVQWDSESEIMETYGENREMWPAHLSEYDGDYPADCLYRGIVAVN